MKKSIAFVAVFVFALAPPLQAQARAQAQAQDGPVQAAYDHKVKWGHQEEFERLFFKNHCPVLEAQMGDHVRITGVR